MARIRAKKKEARHAAVEVEASTTPQTTTKTTMEAVAGVVADGTTTTMRAVVPSMTTTTMTMRTGTAVFPTPMSTLSGLSSVQKGAVEKMRTERTKHLTASAGRGGKVGDGGNDIHDPLTDVNSSVSPATTMTTKTTPHRPRGGAIVGRWGGAGQIVVRDKASN